MALIRNQKCLIAVLGVCLLALSHGATASDTAKEKRWADQITHGPVVGDTVWLEAETRKFLGIYAEDTTGKPRGGVILLHGMGVHPDWAEVIAPLRTELPDFGWATLSIQMPVLGDDAGVVEYAPLFDEVPARIDAAVEFLRRKGFENITLVGHSLGTVMAVHYLAGDTAGAGRIRAFVALGMSEGHPEDPRMDTVALLEKIEIPVLDLYGSQDHAAVQSATSRAAAARRAGNDAYRQDEVPGANHVFLGLDTDLVRRVRSWLSRYAPGEVSVHSSRDRDR